MSRFWLILQCRSRSERTEMGRLREAGIDATYPIVSRKFKRRHRTGSQHKRQTITQKWPLIAGFLFVPATGWADEDYKLILRCAEGPKAKIHGYLGYAPNRLGLRRPYCLPDAELQRMFDSAENLGVRRSLGNVDVGDLAKVMEGYLEGFTLEIVELGETTGKVKFTLFGREIERNVKREDLLPVED